MSSRQDGEQRFHSRFLLEVTQPPSGDSSRGNLDRSSAGSKVLHSAPVRALMSSTDGSVRQNKQAVDCSASGTPASAQLWRRTATETASEVLPSVFHTRGHATRILAATAVRSASQLAAAAKRSAETSGNAACAGTSRFRQGGGLPRELFQSRVWESHAAASLFERMGMPQAALVQSTAVMVEASFRQQPGRVYDSQYSKLEATKAGQRNAPTMRRARSVLEANPARMLGVELVHSSRGEAAAAAKRRREADRRVAQAQAAKVRRKAGTFHHSRRITTALHHRQLILRSSQSHRLQEQSEMQMLTARGRSPSASGPGRTGRGAWTSEEGKRQELERELLRRIWGHWQLRAEVLEDVTTTAVQEQVEALARRQNRRASGRGGNQQQNDDAGKNAANCANEGGRPLETLRTQLRAIAVPSRPNTSARDSEATSSTQGANRGRTSITETMVHRPSTHSSAAFDGGMLGLAGEDVDPGHVDEDLGDEKDEDGTEPDEGTVSSARTHDDRFEYRLVDTGGEFAFVPSRSSSRERSGTAAGCVIRATIVSGFEGPGADDDSGMLSSRPQSSGLVAERHGQHRRSHNGVSSTKSFSTPRLCPIFMVRDDKSPYRRLRARPKTRSLNQPHPRTPFAAESPPLEPLASTMRLEPVDALPDSPASPRASVLGSPSPSPCTVPPDPHRGSAGKSRGTSASKNALQLVAERRRQRLAGALVPWDEFEGHTPLPRPAEEQLQPPSAAIPEMAGKPASRASRPGTVGAMMDAVANSETGADAGRMRGSAGLKPTSPDAKALEVGARGKQRRSLQASPFALRRVMTRTAMRALTLRSTETSGRRTADGSRSTTPAAVAPNSAPGEAIDRLAKSLPAHARSGADAMRARLDAIRSLQGPYASGADCARAAMLSAVVTLDAPIDAAGGKTGAANGEKVLHAVLQTNGNKGWASKRTAATSRTATRSPPHQQAKQLHISANLAPPMSQRSPVGQSILPDAAIRHSAALAGIVLEAERTLRTPLALRGRLHSGTSKRAPAHGPLQGLASHSLPAGQGNAPLHRSANWASGVPMTQSISRAAAEAGEATSGSAATTTEAFPQLTIYGDSTAQAPPTAAGESDLEASYMPRGPPTPHRNSPPCRLAQFVYDHASLRNSATQKALAAANRRDVDASATSLPLEARPGLSTAGCPAGVGAGFGCNAGASAGASAGIVAGIVAGAGPGATMGIDTGTGACAVVRAGPGANGTIHSRGDGIRGQSLIPAISR